MRIESRRMRPAVGTLPLAHGTVAPARFQLAYGEPVNRGELFKLTAQRRIFRTRDIQYGSDLIGFFTCQPGFHRLAAVRSLETPDFSEQCGALLRVEQVSLVQQLLNFAQIF